MLKFAFILDAGKVDPQEYRGIYELEDEYNLIVGVPDMEATVKIVKELAADGYTLMDFCGAYDSEKLEILKQATGAEVEMAYVDYFPEELEKVDALESLSEYGLIIIGGEELKEIVIENPECNTYAYFVRDMEMAKEAAKKLVDRGVYFIELCGWFDSAKTREIIEAIGAKVPVGSAGIA